jgi:hypothetical protein
MEAFLKQKSIADVTDFAIAGASKRGWTTWTTAAVDSRVIAAIPIVMDLLNMRQNFHHCWRAYGGWSNALSDYYAMNITSNLDNPNFQPMADIIDPLSYVNRLTMPKLVITLLATSFSWYAGGGGKCGIVVLDGNERNWGRRGCRNESGIVALVADKETVEGETKRIIKDYQTLSLTALGDRADD